MDRIVVNQEFLGDMGCVEMEHLARTGSDYAPLLLKCGECNQQIHKPFRFLKFWTDNDGFKEVVRHNWVPLQSTGCDDVFIMLKQKMKKTKMALSEWIRVIFGDFVRS